MLNGGQQVDLQGRRPESEALANAVLPPEGRLRSQQIHSDICLSLLFKTQLLSCCSPTISDLPGCISERTQPEWKDTKKDADGQMCVHLSGGGYTGAAKNKHH